MFSRFLAPSTSPSRDERLFGAARRANQAGLETVARESYRQWHIEVTHRQVGLAVRRDQYSARLAPSATGREEYLSGFSTIPAALAAARDRIDKLQEQTTLWWHGPHGRTIRPRRKP